MRLKFYETCDDSLIERYAITTEQLSFTKSPKESIELAKLDRNRHAILVLAEDKLVSFFVLHEKDGVIPYSTNEAALLIRSFSTDYHEQGKGYAKAALQLLPEFVQTHFPHINELVLGVNVPNKSAQALYTKCGFVDEGRQVTRFNDELIVMSYYIK
ncbi:GNAT family N-acetyltransferase [Lysinibacillus sp. B2A1]|nr:GNAT family N-acetyltransferase [Lysinibacillus sp. B2A1]